MKYHLTLLGLLGPLSVTLGEDIIPLSSELEVGDSSLWLWLLLLFMDSTLGVGPLW
jgi:hypothetical protein